MPQRTGSPSQIVNTNHFIHSIVKAHVFKGEKAKPTSFGRRQNINDYIRRGFRNKEYRFALIDYRNGNDVIKTMRMSHQEAKRKNATLEGTGIAWARVDESFKS